MAYALTAGEAIRPSRDNSAATRLAELRQTRAAAMRELRTAFERYGLDVSVYDDHEVSAAVIEEATAATCCSWDLFARAFERLQHGPEVAALVEPGGITRSDLIRL